MCKRTREVSWVTPGKKTESFGKEKIALVMWRRPTRQEKGVMNTWEGDMSLNGAITKRPTAITKI